MPSRSGPIADAFVRSYLRSCGPGPLPVAEVRAALDLPPLPYSKFLGPSSWLAGGSVMKWLMKQETSSRLSRGDFDFYFSSAEALDATARAMVAEGFRLIGHRAIALTLKEYFTGGPTRDRRSGLWDDAGRMVPITPDIIQRLRIAYLELESPEGDVMQLVTYFTPNPAGTISRFDFSICQVAADHQAVSLGPRTAMDLVERRLRVVNIRVPDSTFRRVIKYMKRGYRPGFRAIVQSSWRYFLQALERGPRLILMSLRDRLQSVSPTSRNPVDRPIAPR